MQPLPDSSNQGPVCGIDGCSTTVEPAVSAQRVDANPATFDLSIVSDVICPWCFVAKRNLEIALAITGPEFAIKVDWLPYELNPSMPPEGLDRRQYRSRKFGSWEQSQALDAQVAEAGRKVGIVFRHDLMTRTPNTFQAHRLIWLASEHGRQDDLVEGLFRAYFTEGRDVGDRATLVSVATEAGLPASLVAEFLDGTEAAAEVRAAESAALSSGTSGVPSFQINGKFLFAGALKPELLAARLREVARANV